MVEGSILTMSKFVIVNSSNEYCIGYAQGIVYWRSSDEVAVKFDSKDEADKICKVINKLCFREVARVVRS